VCNETLKYSPVCVTLDTTYLVEGNYILSIAVQTSNNWYEFKDDLSFEVNPRIIKSDFIPYDSNLRGIIEIPYFFNQLNN
jgi:hypothetical protein